MQQGSAKLGQDLRIYMQEHGETQADIADKADVNQATVSRFLKKPPQRVTVARQKLCSYAETVLKRDELQPEKTDALRALEECLNKSDACAKAASKILGALAELCRTEQDEEEVASG
jgi:transcriptional regulator with XRE-family HTH domain